MKKIIAATDFSDAALNAVAYAADMAVFLQAELLLLYVYPLPVVHSDLPTTAIDNELMEESISMLREIKNKIKHRVSNAIPVQSEVKMGFFNEELNAISEQLQPYLVVIGTQGKTAAEKLWFGSHAVHAMQEIPWPIIAVPPSVSFSPLHKIALATDYTRLPENYVVEELEQLVTDFRAELHIINIGNHNNDHPETKSGMDIINKRLAHLKPFYHFAASSETDKAMLDFAEINAIDLLIILPGRRGFFEKMMHRSHTRQVVLHSSVPVMALHQ
ncbi:MAG: universal stress protein [Bacteroidota bacterium]